MVHSPRRITRIAAPFVSLLVLLAVWTIVFQTGQIPSMVLPSPADTLRAITDNFWTGLIWPHLFATLNAAALGFLSGSGLALVLATVLATYPWAERFLMIHVLAFQAIPKVALAPLVFIWCGFGMLSTVTMVALACFYPVFANAFVGFRAADTNLTDMYRAFGSSKLRIFWSVRLPAAAGQIFTGLEVSIVYAFIAAVVMEFIAGSKGLGYLVVDSSSTLDSASAFAALFVLALLGIGAASIMRIVRRRLIFWDTGLGEPGYPTSQLSTSAIRTAFAVSLTTLALIAIWTYFTSPGGMPPSVLPSPMDVIRALHTGLINGQLWQHIVFTTCAALSGLLLGAMSGLLLSTGVVIVPLAEPFVMPIIVGLQSVPKVALAPLLIWYLGFGIESKVVTAAILCFFPIFVAGVNGMRSLSPDLVDLYRAASASRWHVLVNAQLPAAAPYLFTGMQIAIVLSLTGSVVSEFVASSRGLGYIIRARSQELDLSMAFAAIVVLSVLGVFASLFVRAAQRKLVFWQAG